MLEQIATCTFDRWSPVIGDPTVIGWVTVVAYAVAAVLAWRAVRRAKYVYRQEVVPMQKFFWISVAVLFLFLSINKQLDLQSFLTTSARCYARIDGWYQERRIVQVIFIGSLIGIMTLGFMFVVIKMRKIVRANWLALLGVFLVVLFILVRAVGFHHFDQVINFTVNDVRMNWVLELGGISLVILGAVLSPRSKGKKGKEAVYIDWSKQEDESA